MQHDGALQGAGFHGPAPLRAIAYNRGMNAQLGLLVVCQSLYLVNNITFIAINGLVGLALAPQAWMATLPIMGYVLGGALSTGLVARTQRRDQLHRARRQLDLLRDQDLASVDLRVVVNRFEKGLLRTVKPADLQKALGRDIAYTVTNEPAVMHPAIERGVPISDIKRKSAVGKDIDMLDAGIAAALGRER